MPFEMCTKKKAMGKYLKQQRCVIYGGKGEIGLPC